MQVKPERQQGFGLPGYSAMEEDSKETFFI